MVRLARFKLEFHDTFCRPFRVTVTAQRPIFFGITEASVAVKLSSMLQIVVKEILLKLCKVFHNWWYNWKEGDSAGKNKSKTENNIFSYQAWFSGKSTLDIRHCLRLLLDFLLLY